MIPVTIRHILEQVPKLAQEWADQRAERQRRTKADPADFARLGDLGIPRMAVPVELGGTWESIAQSARPICTMLRALAPGDSSVALTSTMHQLILNAWRMPSVPQPYTQGWDAQRREVFQTVLDGAWWGVIVSEPGSGGDTSLTRSEATPSNPPWGYRMSGNKHFGSGMGVTSFMTTHAVPTGEKDPDQFFIKVRDAPWDGSTGMKLVAEWRGHGMMSTNSHAFQFTDFPATRIAWPGHQRELGEINVGLPAMGFTSVIVGVVDAAMDYTRGRLKAGRSQGSALRAYQQVEWTLAEQEAWLIDQAWEGTMRAFERDAQSNRNVLLAKESIARLAESALGRLCKLSGGAAYTWYSPLSAWLEDVRALGFLRPPWALAFDQLFEQSWKE